MFQPLEVAKAWLVVFRRGAVPLPLPCAAITLATTCASWAPAATDDEVGVGGRSCLRLPVAPLCCGGVATLLDVDTTVGVVCVAAFGSSVTSLVVAQPPPTPPASEDCWGAATGVSCDAPAPLSRAWVI